MFGWLKPRPPKDRDVSRSGKGGKRKADEAEKKRRKKRAQNAGKKAGKKNKKKQVAPGRQIAATRSRTARRGSATRPPGRKRAWPRRARSH